MSDTRAELYQDLHGRQLTGEETRNRSSAQRILDILWEYLRPASVLDVGCGLGTWLSVLAQRGVADLRGIDGLWLSNATLMCDPSWVETCDLEAGFDLGRTFDLVVSLEVGEHLAPAAAERFVDSLARHADAVLYSAAIPFQGGHHHVNEQFLPYWAKHFGERGYRPFDLFRRRIWDDAEVHWWLRQNIVLFVHDRLIAAHESLRQAMSLDPGPLSVVHPEVYVSRIQGLLNRLGEAQRLESYLRAGGLFRTGIDAKGALKVEKIVQKR